ncbi:MAG: hypothetical protein SH868_19855 [Bythopirellula sp.]|nr:hypothetical protein [Bythopirellula sp.]
MVNIVVDSELLAKLGDLQSPVTLQDASGRVLAYLTPAKDRSIYDELDPGISDEELNRRRAAGGGKPLEEWLKEFESRANGAD